MRLAQWFSPPLESTMRRTPWTLVLIAVLAFFAPSTLGAARAAAVTPRLSDIVASGTSYGSYVLSDLASVRSGPTAYSTLGCTRATPLTRTNSAATVTVPVVGQVGAVSTSVRTSQTTTAKTAQADSTTASVNLLGGLITGSTLRSTAATTISSTGVTTNRQSVSFASLRVSGVAVAANPAPNTTLALRSGSTVIGKVVVNEQSRQASPWAGIATTRVLSVYITSSNPLGLPIGTRIIVGHAGVLAKASPAGQVGGAGFAARSALADGTVKNGPLSYMTVPCLGGTASASAASLAQPGVLTAGATRTDTSSSVGSSLRSSVVSKVTGLSLLGGLITADAVTASATTTRSAPGAAPVSTDGSTVANLRVAGVPVIDGTVAPNTVVRIPGVATVTLHKVVRTSTGLTVTMVEVRLEKVFGALPTGSLVEVAQARTYVV